MTGKCGYLSPVGNANESVKLPQSADTDGYDLLLRTHVSRRAAGKGRAVLEGVGLDAPTIAACYTAHPLNEEETVQDGLTLQWCGGEGFQPPTREVLIEAVEYAEIAKQDIHSLKEGLGLH